MYLYIDNSIDEKIVFKWLSSEQSVRDRVFFRSKDKPLIYFLDKFLTSLNKNLKDIKGIAILLGAGKFTATRILSTSANTLSYVLKVPIISVSNFSEQEILAKLKKAKFGKYVATSYSAPPHIDGVQK